MRDADGVPELSLGLLANKPGYEPKLDPSQQLYNRPPCNVPTIGGINGVPVLQLTHHRMCTCNGPTAGGIDMDPPQEVLMVSLSSAYFHLFRLYFFLAASCSGLRTEAAGA